MNVDIEIYISNVVKFFKKNPQDLLNLVPKEKEQELYDRIRSTAEQNFKEGKDVVLTQKQILEICVELNGKKVKEEKLDEKIFMKSPIGFICLN
jgi:hypothetical protein